MKNSDKILLGLAGLGGLAILMSKNNTGVAQASIPSGSVGIKTDSDRLIDIATRELNLPVSGLTVRGVNPSDFGLASYTFALVPGWNTIISTTAGHKAIMLTGLYYSSATPVASEVRVSMGASSVEDWAIQSVPVQQNHQYIDITPSIAHPDYPITIQVFATAASASETISFEGVVAEARGTTLY